MEITFLKDHLDRKVGDNVTVMDDLGNYLIRCNVAEEANGKKAAPVNPYVRPSRAKASPTKTKSSEKGDEEFDL
jgi:hypothetical protein